MSEAPEVKRGSWGRMLGFAAALAIPALLAVLFWRTTPIGGGWAPSEGAAPSAHGRSPGGAPAAPELPASSQSPQEAYRANCARCHGENFEGTGTVPALRRPNWPYGKDRGLLVKIIHEGRGLTMPGFEGRLSNQQIEALADWIQTTNGAPAP